MNSVFNIWDFSMILWIYLTSLGYLSLCIIYSMFSRLLLGSILLWLLFSVARYHMALVFQKSLGLLQFSCIFISSFSWAIFMKSISVIQYQISGSSHETLHACKTSTTWVTLKLQRSGASTMFIFTYKHIEKNES